MTYRTPATAAAAARVRRGVRASASSGDSSGRCGRGRGGVRWCWGWSGRTRASAASKMAAAAARVSGELVRERERGSGEARGGMGCGGARLYSLGGPASFGRGSGRSGDPGSFGIRSISGEVVAWARGWGRRGGWSWAGLARLACWPSGPAGLGQAGRGGVRRWLGLGWPGWRPGGFFFIFLNKTKTKIKHYL